MGGRVYTLNIREGEERRPGLTNLYSEEVTSLQPQYSVPARRLRKRLPSPPDTETLTRWSVREDFLKLMRRMSLSIYE